MTSAKHNAHETRNEIEGSSIPKGNDHEDNVRTLPQSHGDSAVRGSVMSAEPPLWGGPRSGGAAVEESADGVVSGFGAEATEPEIVPAADREAERRVKLVGVAGLATSMHNVIEEVIGIVATNPKNTHAVCVAAKAMLDAIEEHRLARKDGHPGGNTLKDYEKKCRRIEEAMEDGEGVYIERLTNVMGTLGRSRQSFNAYRAAMRHSCVQELKMELTAIEGVRVGAFGVKEGLTKSLARSLLHLCSVVQLDHAACLQMVGTKKKRPTSKKNMLKRLPSDWRERVLAEAAASDAYGLPSVLLDVCGLRPVELEKGVSLTVAGNHVEVHIQGGKVRATAGQPWRRFTLRRDAFPDWALTKLPPGKAVWVTADPGNHRSFLGRISQRLFPRHSPPKKADVLISPYVFRHAIVTDMRDDGWSNEDIASVIGESSAATVAWYGLIRRDTHSSGRSPDARRVSVGRASLQTARKIAVRIDDRAPRSVSSKGRGIARAASPQ